MIQQILPTGDSTVRFWYQLYQMASMDIKISTTDLGWCNLVVSKQWYIFAVTHGNTYGNMAARMVIFD